MFKGGKIQQEIGEEFVDGGIVSSESQHNLVPVLE